MKVALYEIMRAWRIPLINVCKIIVYGVLSCSLICSDVWGLSLGYYDSYQLTNHILGIDYFLTAAHYNTALIYAGFQSQLNFQHQHLSGGIGYRETLSLGRYAGAYCFLDGTWDRKYNVNFSTLNIGIESGSTAVSYKLNFYLPNYLHTASKRAPLNTLPFNPKENTLSRTQPYFADESIDYGLDWQFSYNGWKHYILGGGLYYFQKDPIELSTVGGMLGVAYAIKPSFFVKAQSIYDTVGGWGVTFGVSFAPKDNATHTSPLMNKMARSLSRTAVPRGMIRQESEVFHNCYFCLPNVTHDANASKALGTVENPTAFSQQLIEKAPCDAKFVLQLDPINPKETFYKVQKIDLKPGQWISGILITDPEGNTFDPQGNVLTRSIRPMLQFEHINLHSDNRISQCNLAFIQQNETEEAITINKKSVEVYIDDVELYITRLLTNSQVIIGIGLHDETRPRLEDVYMHIHNPNFFSNTKVYGILGTPQDLVAMGGVHIALESFSNQDELRVIEGARITAYKENNYELAQPQCSIYNALSPVIDSKPKGSARSWREKKETLKQKKLLKEIGRLKEQVSLLINVLEVYVLEVPEDEAVNIKQLQHELKASVSQSAEENERDYLADLLSRSAAKFFRGVDNSENQLYSEQLMNQTVALREKIRLLTDELGRQKNKSNKLNELYHELKASLERKMVENDEPYLKNLLSQSALQWSIPTNRASRFHKEQLANEVFELKEKIQLLIEWLAMQQNKTENLNKLHAELKASLERNVVKNEREYLKMLLSEGPVKIFMRDNHESQFHSLSILAEQFEQQQQLNQRNKSALNEESLYQIKLLEPELKNLTEYVYDHYDKKPLSEVIAQKMGHVY